jgi:hypothetical protein
LKIQLRALLPVFLAAVLSGGCNTFNHEWKTAAAEPALDSSLQGRWQGVWVSEVTGHTDELKCVIERNADGTYRARFHAKYHQVLSFGYTVSLKVQSSGDGFTFEGDANLGWYAGGIYHYEGRADATNFHSTYSCKYDHGTFQMGRVGSGA